MPVNTANDQRPMLANSNVKLNTPRKELSTAWRKTPNNSNVPLRPQCDEALMSRRGLKRCEVTSTQPTPTMSQSDNMSTSALPLSSMRRGKSMVFKVLLLLMVRLRPLRTHSNRRVGVGSRGGLTSWRRDLPTGMAPFIKSLAKSPSLAEDTSESRFRGGWNDIGKTESD
ncbi:hypothetical protein V496_04401 [Pseudogymnoascus sp. VKM F-4515 (FW-2607)]|nr:hypothetical protein V496_04401 [Pseudogymnoascus sp. VKM F-4515 (FW-2607)]